MNKKVSKANKSQTLLRYSKTYGLISLSGRRCKPKIAVRVAKCTRHPYLDVRGAVLESQWFPRQTADFDHRPRLRP